MFSICSRVAAYAEGWLKLDLSYAQIFSCAGGQHSQLSCCSRVNCIWKRELANKDESEVKKQKSGNAGGEIWLKHLYLGRNSWQWGYRCRRHRRASRNAEELNEGEFINISEENGFDE